MVLGPWQARTIGIGVKGLGFRVWGLEVLGGFSKNM